MTSESRGLPTMFSLPEFMPFRLNRLADAVSRNLSEIYRSRFGLEIPEWRVLVTIGQRKCTAQHVVSSTRMHKTRVSRAVAGLQKRGLIAREVDHDDGREMRLQLTTAGRRTYAALVPLALARERELLACLTDAQRKALDRALATLERVLELSAVPGRSRAESCDN